MKRYESWGRYPRVDHAGVIPINWRSRVPPLDECPSPVLPFGQGRSYGDACLNENGILLDASGLSKFMSIDHESGLVRCEAGVTLGEILRVAVPRGWFLPVTPGTKYVSVGGAIANDVHGKNHHRDGTFGRHVRKFELLRSNGERLVCSPSDHTNYFCATIGGLGLTGLILWAEVQLKPITSAYLGVEAVCFGGLAEFLDLARAADQAYEYTVAWVDCLASGRSLGRGVFFRGNHLQDTGGNLTVHGDPKWMVPFDAPGFLLNPMVMKGFNWSYFHSRGSGSKMTRTHYDPFFYPLDAIGDWNRLYGAGGFFQYQCVVPYTNDAAPVKEILGRIAKAGTGSFLSVLKCFGDHRSPGMMSFPRPGITLALDFRNEGRDTLALLETFDQIVRDAGGSVYPAKDARMSGDSFRTFFPRWSEFSRYIDSKFSSSLWRRVTGAAG